MGAGLSPPPGQKRKLVPIRLDAGAPRFYAAETAFAGAS
jgi:hypothetical protein